MAHPLVYVKYAKPDDAERQLNLREVQELKPGDRVIFNSWEAPERKGTYDAVVVGVYPYHITLEITLRRDTSEFQILWDPQPYNFSIQYKRIGKTNYIWKPIEREEYAV